MQNENPPYPTRDRAVLAWLWLLFTTLFVMVLVGGITRLTGSGLSMVDWRPLMGAIPPLGDAQWNEVFAAYKLSPQYRDVNTWMELPDFKRIFFWEYAHRLLGRVIGLISFVPWLYFRLRGRLSPWLSFRVLVAVALGGMQGLLGWYMVRSGLVDRPEVSHFRLAAHLMLAFVIAQWVLWTLFDLLWGRERGATSRGGALAIGLGAILALQVLYGAFMAGTHAGLLFPSFPDMNGGYAPGQFFPRSTLFDNLFYSPIAIHYVHRVLGVLLLVYGGIVLMALRGSAGIADWVKQQFAVALTLQFCLGVITALYQSPLWAAIAHQAGAFVLACSVCVVVHRALGVTNEPLASAEIDGAR